MLGKGSGWIIDSVIDYNINNSKCNSLAGSSYIKSPKELDHHNECFKWCLHPADQSRKRITKAYRDFTKKLDFKDIKFPVKVRDIHKIEKRIPLALVFLVMKIGRNIQSMYQKNVAKKNMLIYY